MLKQCSLVVSVLCLRGRPTLRVWYSFGVVMFLWKVGWRSGSSLLNLIRWPNCFAASAWTMVLTGRMRLHPRGRIALHCWYTDGSHKCICYVTDLCTLYRYTLYIYIYTYLLMTVSKLTYFVRAFRWSCGMSRNCWAKIYVFDFSSNLRTALVQPWPPLQQYQGLGMLMRQAQERRLRE